MVYTAPAPGPTPTPVFVPALAPDAGVVLVDVNAGPLEGVVTAEADGAATWDPDADGAEELGGCCAESERSLAVAFEAVRFLNVLLLLFTPPLPVFVPLLEVVLSLVILVGEVAWNPARRDCSNGTAAAGVVAMRGWVVVGDLFVVGELGRLGPATLVGEAGAGGRRMCVWVWATWV